MRVILDNRLNWQYTDWTQYFHDYEIEWSWAKQGSFPDDPFRTPDPEQLARRLAAFHGQDCDRALCIVSGLYLDELPPDDPLQPGFAPRVQADGQPIPCDPDRFYAGLARRLGGGSRPCRAIDAFAVYNCGKIESFTADHDGLRLLLSDEPYPYWNSAWQLLGALFDAETGHSLAEPETDPDILRARVHRAKQYRQEAAQRLAEALGLHRRVVPPAGEPRRAYTIDISWSPDFPGLNQETKYAAARAFARDLGIKSDSVGWADREAVTPDFMDRLEALAEDTGAELRGGMSILPAEQPESGWYRLLMQDHPAEGWNWEHFQWDAYPGDHPTICQFKNYLLAPAYPVMTGQQAVCLVPEPVKDVLRGLCGDAVEFIWLEDTGKYDAVQYYDVLPRTMLERCLGGFDCISECCRSARAARLSRFGETAARVGGLYRELSVSLLFGVRRSWLPESGIAGFMETSHNTRELLVRQDIRDGLLAAGVCKPGDFAPLLVFEDGEPLEPGWPETAGYLPTFPQALLDELERRHAKLAKKRRPRRAATEKTALRVLRLLKKDAPERFGRRISPGEAERLPEPQLLPYYRLSNGFSLAEYDIFPAGELEQRTAELLGLQELENFSLDGLRTAFGYADGEWLLLLEDGRVVRYAVGAPLWVCEWQTLALFLQETAEKTLTEWLK